ncbi:Metallothionein expression activator [Blyttiomyces sp. JEL0837]|nr:Metallothionein expression activator [Blyttiomyces sp. JEL0837]
MSAPTSVLNNEHGFNAADIDNDILHEFGLGLNGHHPNMGEASIPSIMLQPTQSERDLNAILNDPPLNTNLARTGPISIATMKKESDFMFPRESGGSVSYLSASPRGSMATTSAPPSPALSVRSDFSVSSTFSAQSDFGFYPELANFTLSPTTMDPIPELTDPNDLLSPEAQAAMDAMFSDTINGYPQHQHHHHPQQYLQHYSTHAPISPSMSHHHSVPSPSSPLRMSSASSSGSNPGYSSPQSFGPAFAPRQGQNVGMHPPLLMKPIAPNSLLQHPPQKNYVVGSGRSSPSPSHNYNDLLTPRQIPTAIIRQGPGPSSLGIHHYSQGSVPIPSPTGKKRAASADPSNLLRCTHEGCTQVFNKALNLRSHLKTHAAEKVFTCPLCTASFRRSHDLKRHARSLHTGVKPFVCNKCPKSFSRMDALKRHVSRPSSNCFVDLSQGGMKILHDMVRAQGINPESFDITIPGVM